MSERKVIIVGGGICGLIAARMLADKFEVTLLEHRKETGGRIRSVPLPDGAVFAEAGAEFVHGDLPVTMALLKEAGLDHVNADGKVLRKEGKVWEEKEEMIDGWDTLMRVMEKQVPDVTMQALLDEYFPGDRYADFRRQVRQFVQGFDVAEPEKVSVQSLYREWAAQETNYRIPEGYSSLVRFLEQDCVKKGVRILTGRTVKRVDWQQNDVTVYIENGEKFAGERLLITVPINVLRDREGPCSIAIIPQIEDYINASFKIGFGTVIKIILEFDRPLLKENVAFVLSNEKIPTWWSQFPIRNNLLTGWAGGPMAERLTHHTDEELLQIAIGSIANIFDMPQPEVARNLKRSFIFNWKNYSEVLGAYSYSTPESSEARKLLNTPVANTLFFAGEGLYDGKNSGTVEAALVSGRDVAQRILES